MGFENGRLVRVVLSAEHSTDGDRQVNTLHYDLIDSDPLEANDPQLLANRFRDDVVGHIVNRYTPQWIVQPVIVMEEIDPLDKYAPRQEWISGAPTAGSRVAAGELLPRACCAVATLDTDHVGRRHRGRIFVGSSFDESDQSNGVWDTGTGHWQTIIDFLNTIPLEPDITATTSLSRAHWCVFSRTQRKIEGPSYASKVIGHRLHSKVHWLRSREPA